MGTSKGYEAPKTPQWAAVKRLVTSTARNGPLERDDAQLVVRAFIDASGGPRIASRGAGSLGRGKAAQRVAASIAGFVDLVQKRGLAEALDQLGLNALLGRPVIEVLDALVDALGGPAESLDDIDARNALAKLRAEMFNDLETLEELEEAMSELVSSEELGDLLVTFFGLYLFEQFTRLFYERLVARVGDATAASYLREIADYIRSVVRLHHVGKTLTHVNWSSESGRAVVDEILENTLQVFGGAS